MFKDFSLCLFGTKFDDVSPRLCHCQKERMLKISKTSIKEPTHPKTPLKRHEPIKLASEAPLLLLEWIICKISCWLRSTDDLLGGPPALLLPPLLGASVSCGDSLPPEAEDVSGDLWRPSLAAGVFMGRRAGELTNTFGVVTPRWTSEESSFPDG